jgi:Carboxypeptidase regulatory-like domain
LSLRNPRMARVLAVLVISCLLSVSSQAQAVDSSRVSGSATGPSGQAIPNAAVTVKNLASGKAITLATNELGTFEMQDLVAGDYEISASAVGFNATEEKVSLASGASQTVNLALSVPLGQTPAPFQGGQQGPPKAPSLSDLGFPPAETKANPQLQARLDKRSHMLQIHQRLGLITVAPLAATVILGGFAGGRRTSSTDRNIHAALGATTAGLYFSSAYFAIFAPKIPGTKTEGPIRLHKALAWIHGPGMILTPILGAMAYDQKSKGEKVHGIAQLHGTVAIVTAVAYGLAILAVSRKSKSHSAGNAAPAPDASQKASKKHPSSPAHATSP